jgi:hypothetical protein
MRGKSSARGATFSLRLQLCSGAGEGSRCGYPERFGRACIHRMQHASRKRHGSRKPRSPPVVNLSPANLLSKRSAGPMRQRGRASVSKLYAAIDALSQEKERDELASQRREGGRGAGRRGLASQESPGSARRENGHRGGGAQENRIHCGAAPDNTPHTYTAPGTRRVLQGACEKGRAEGCKPPPCPPPLPSPRAAHYVPLCTPKPCRFLKAAPKKAIPVLRARYAQIVPPPPPPLPLP